MSRKVWLEVALNGGWKRDNQPNVPLTVDEIVAEAVACAAAGAAIVHAHPNAAPTLATDPSSSGKGGFGSIAEAIAIQRAVRDETDAIVYPSIAGPTVPGDYERRFAPLADLAELGLLEWFPLDPGSWNCHAVDPAAPTLFTAGGGVIAKPQELLDYGAEFAVDRGLHPAYACYEPGFVRLGRALHREHPGMPAPVYRLMFSSAFTFGFPPTEWALEAYAKLIEDVAPTAPWMVAGLGADVLTLVPSTVALGGHVRVGLEDAPLGCTLTNAQLVTEAVAVIRKAGAEPASPADVRVELAALNRRAPARPTGSRVTRLSEPTSPSHRDRAPDV